LEKGGLKTSHRYLDPGSVEFALVRAREGNEVDQEVGDNKNSSANSKADLIQFGVASTNTPLVEIGSHILRGSFQHRLPDICFVFAGI